LKLATLKTRAEFNRVRAGPKWVARAFLLQAMQRTEDDEEPPRFGFAVSSKALSEPAARGKVKRPGAVKRNRGRRRLKEAVRLVAPLHAKPNYDYVLVGRREVLHQRFIDLLEDMQFAFARVHRPPRAQDDKARSGRGRKASAGGTQREIEET
jgi:ribonuclease P protein component